MLIVVGKLFVGKEMGNAGKGNDGGKAMHVYITVQLFLSICFSFSDRPKDLGKLESLESVECFFISFLQLSKIEVAIAVKGSVLSVLNT